MSDQSDDTDGDNEAGESYDKEAVLKEARERWELVEDAGRENREQYREDYAFVYSPGSQWDATIAAQRKTWKEPSLEFNQLPQFVHQVVNDQRQARPGIRIHAAGARASKEVAEIAQGLVRGIEYQSQAESAYDTGYECAVVGGRGWWRIVSEYEPGKTFNQRIRIMPIKDSLRVRADDEYQMADARDRRFLFVYETVPKDEFERRWPNAEPIDWQSIEGVWSDGADKDCIVVADYYRRVITLRTLVMMSDGAIGWKDELPKKLPPGVRIQREREVEQAEVEWFKIAGGQQVLERHEVPGQYIPVIQTVGDEVMIDGRRIFQGLIRHAKDPQRMLNYGMTQQAVHLALTPRAPWVAAAGQIEQYKEIWKNANTTNYSYLPYDPLEVNGTLVPPPQRTQPSMPDAGWLNWTQQQLAMIKSTIGMYESSLGQRNNEQSGRAILAREKQGDTATFHFADNQARAIALTGEIIMSWIPVYYDTYRMVHSVGIDGSRSVVAINQPGVGMDPVTGAIRAIKNNDVTEGEYAVAVETGPSYNTKRQESADKLADLVKAFPPMMQVAGDIVVRAQDIPDADALADRLQMMMPPPVQAAIQAKARGDKPPPPEMLQAQGQIAQMQKALEAAAQEIQRLKSGVIEKLEVAKFSATVDQQLEERRIAAERDRMIGEAQANAALAIRKAAHEAQIKLATAKVDGALKIQLALIDRMTKIEVAEMANAAEVERLRLVQEAEAQARQGELFAEAAVQAREHQHERDMADAQQAHEAVTQETDIAAAQEQADSAGTAQGETQ